MFEKIKNFFKKLFHKIADGFKAIAKAISKHARSIVKAIAGVGVSAMVVGTYKFIAAPVKEAHKVTYYVEYIGALMLAAVLMHASDHWIDEQCDDIFETVDTVKQAFSVMNGDIPDYQSTEEVPA